MFFPLVLGIQASPQWVWGIPEVFTLARTMPTIAMLEDHIVDQYNDEEGATLVSKSRLRRGFRQRIDDRMPRR